MSELIQSKSALNQRYSALKIQCFRTKKISAEQRWTALIQSWTALIQSCFSLKQRCSALKQRWIFRLWTALKLSWSALVFFMFSESALKNVKTMKQRCSALIISVTSTRDSSQLFLHCSQKLVNFPLTHALEVVNIKCFFKKNIRVLSNQAGNMTIKKDLAPTLLNFIDYTPIAASFIMNCT